MVGGFVLNNRGQRPVSGTQNGFAGKRKESPPCWSGVALKRATQSADLAGLARPEVERSS